MVKAEISEKKSSSKRRRGRPGYPLGKKLQKAEILKEERKHFTKQWSRFLQPEFDTSKRSGKGTHNMPHKIWYVSNTKEADAAKHRKIKVSATTPRKAAAFALKQEGWGTSRAYVVDGRGTGVAFGWKISEGKGGRRMLEELHQGAQHKQVFRPLEVSEDLSSSSGSESGEYDAHAKPASKKRGRPFGSKNKKSSKSRKSSKKVVVEVSSSGSDLGSGAKKRAASSAAKLAGSEATHGEKKATSTLVKEAVAEFIHDHTEKVSQTQANKHASELKREVKALAKEQGLTKESANAAGEASAEAVKKVLTRKRRSEAERLAASHF